MDAGKNVGGTAAVAAARQIGAPDAIGLLTPKGELAPADDARRSPSRTATTSAAPVAPTRTELSDGARLLLRLMGGAPTDTAGLRASQPLLPPPDAAGVAGADIADALRSAVEHSGLFYESHLADWVAGQRKLEAIRSEPQAALPASQRHGHAAAAAPTAVPTDVGTPPSNAGDSAGGSSGGSAGGSTGGNAASLATLATLVGAQLDLLDHGQLRWQGELWPGMPAEIWLQPAAPARHGRDADDAGKDSSADSDGSEHSAGGERCWQARLVTTLPVLGKVSTRFTLQEDRLELRLSSAQSATLAMLRAALPQLAGNMDAAGIRLQGVTSDVDPA